MKLFGIDLGGGDERDDAQRARDEASTRAIQAGGLPLDAVDRLQEAAGKRFFTSNLTVGELLLTHECGFEPKGQVMGSSVYNVGYQWTPGSWSYGSGELEVVTAAYDQARHLALGRLAQEARLLQADGVVGVRLEVRDFEAGSGLLEYVALGTAVRRKGAPPAHGEPFLSDLSGADHWTLREGGYKPVGFCTGNCTWYQVGDYQTQMAQSGGWFGGQWQNQELTGYTQAIYNARHLAMTRMAAEAQAVGAEGIAGVNLFQRLEMRDVDMGENRPSRKDLVVHFTTIGTAVAPDFAHPTDKPLAVVRLR